MKINDRVKITKSTGMSGYTKDYIEMTGVIIEVKEIAPDIKTRLKGMDSAAVNYWTSKTYVVKIDDKFTRKHLCMRAHFFTEELEVIYTEDDSEPFEIETEVYINDNFEKGGETFVVFDYIDQSVSYKGNMYDIVNDYVLPLCVDNEWEEDEEIAEALLLKNENELRDFLYNNMSSYLQ
jgi:hypothetical protein